MHSVLRLLTDIGTFDLNVSCNTTTCPTIGFECEISPLLTWRATLGHRRQQVRVLGSLDRVAEVLASELGVGSKLLFNAEDLVVLGQPLRPAWGASLDLRKNKKNKKP